MGRKVCEKCHREMEDINFYTYRNGQKTEMCKSCMTLHIDNFDQSTYVWLLEKMDVPYIPIIWNLIRDKAYAKNPSKMNGMSVFGKYLSQMKLKQWNRFHWADSEQACNLANSQLKIKEQENQVQQEKIKEQFEKGQISEAQYRTLVSTQFQKEHEYITDAADPIGADNMFNEKNFIAEQDLPDLSAELTLEDKQYLAMKWGRTYKISEWVELQKKYTEMMQSFDIQDADSKNTLIFICKTYLKMNQAIDCGDVQGYQKLSRVYDTLRKSMKVTAAQNKEEKAQFIDSVGQLVAYCQKNGGQIPRYEIKTPYDIVDKIIDDLKAYNRSLVYEDTALARQIQDYIKEARAAAANRRDRAQAKEKGFEAPELSNQDLLDFKDFLEKQRQETQTETFGGKDES